MCIDGLLNLGTFRASNVSHTVVLRPLKAGYFNFTSATVSYLAQEGGQVVVKPVDVLDGSKQWKCWMKWRKLKCVSSPAGRLHQRPRPGRHPGPEGVWSALLPSLCESLSFSWKPSQTPNKVNDLQWDVWMRFWIVTENQLCDEHRFTYTFCSAG